MNPKVILETALNREEISAIESLILMLEGDAVLEDLTHVADTLNQKAHHNVVTYIRTVQINYTNGCTGNCTLCQYLPHKPPRQRFTLLPQTILQKIKEGNGFREIHLQGGLNPELDLHYHLRFLRILREVLPHASIHGYSPQSIRFIAKRARTTIYDVLRKFKEAGLDSMPGTGAVILNDKIRKKLCPDQLKTHEWIDLVRTAHRLGITTTATLLVGHIENNVHISEHLDIIKNIQKETGGFTGFAVAPYSAYLPKFHRRPNPQEDNLLLKINAISRIFYHRYIKNIETDVQKCGLPVSVRSLSSGVNDIGSIHQNVYPAGHKHHPLITSTSLRNEIIKAGRIPIERHPHKQKQAASSDSFSTAAAKSAALPNIVISSPPPSRSRPAHEPYRSTSPAL